MNQQVLEGNWKQLRGKLKKAWANVTDDELEYVEGNLDQLVGLLQQKTGETRAAIQKKLDELCEECDSSMVSQAAETAQQYAEKATETVKKYANSAAEAVQHSGESVGEAVKHGYAEAEDLVRHRPVESLAVTFGAGLIVGVVAGLMLRSR